MLRAVNYLLITLVISLILGVGAFFIVRETFLNWGTSSLKDSVRLLSATAKGSTYNDECQDRGSRVDSITGSAFTAHLRFWTSQEFVIEVVCNQYSFDPILVSQGSLPGYISKRPGSSGFRYDDGRSAVVLEVFEDLETQVSTLLHRNINWISKSRAVVLSDGSISTSEVTPTFDTGDGPVTSCSGYGFTCCQASTQKGVGERITGLNDCQESCYAQCITRPSVIAFNPNPFFDNAKERIVQVRPNTAVEFSIVTDTTETTGLTGTIDFGDGRKTQVTDLTKPTTHSFACPSGACQYTVSVLLVDKWGTESAVTPITKITVVVQD